MTRHRERHPAAAGPVPGCAPCRWRDVQVSPAATPTRQGDPGQYAFQARFAAEFHNGDREAYRRLRANGMQPPRIAGSAELERHAETPFEIATGAVTDNRRGLNAALAMCADAGLDPLAPATTPLSEV